MASKRVQSTAFGVATLRALESYVPTGRRLFDDTVAEQLLTGLPAVIVRSTVVRRLFVPLMERAAPGFYGGVVCRTRAIDDACLSALAEGVTQVVILGAGLDTRPYRMAGLRASTVWELDLAPVQDAKKSAIARVFGELPAHVRYLPVDFAAQRIPDVLAGDGFDPAAPTLLLWEAVSQYLPRAAAEETLAFAGTLAPGSSLVFTYMPQSVIDGPKYARQVRRFQWQTGFDPAGLAAHLARHRLTLLSDLGAEEYQDRYLRPRNRVLPVFPIERVSVARVSS